jgi:hypothetical protein
MYAILRILTDEPGVFALHCHLGEPAPAEGGGPFYRVILNVCISLAGWHLVHGKMAAVVVQPQAIQNFDIPEAALHVRPH